MRRATAVSTAPSVPRRPPARLSLRTSAPVVLHPLVPCVEVRHRPSISPPPTEIGSPGRQRRLSRVHRCSQGVTIAFRPTQSLRHAGNQVNVWKQSPGASTAASPDGASAGGTSPPRDAGSAPAPRSSRGRFRPSLTTRAPSAAGCRRKTDPLAASPHLTANAHSGLPDVEFLFRPSPASVPAVEARRCGAYSRFAGAASSCREPCAREHRLLSDVQRWHRLALCAPAEFSSRRLLPAR